MRGAHPGLALRSARLAFHLLRHVCHRCVHAARLRHSSRSRRGCVTLYRSTRGQALPNAAPHGRPVIKGPRPCPRDRLWHGRLFSLRPPRGVARCLSFRRFDAQGWQRCPVHCSAQQPAPCLAPMQSRRSRPSTRSVRTRGACRIVQETSLSAHAPFAPADKRQAEAARIKDKYPDRVPVRSTARYRARRVAPRETRFQSAHACACWNRRALCRGLRVPRRSPGYR